LSSFLQRRVAVYDKDREGHYNPISALHKSIRGSDPQAALYYLARMLTAGEEPLYVLRRLTRAAIEDIGLADPQALSQCLAAKDAYEFWARRRASWRSSKPALLRDRAKIQCGLQGTEAGLADREGNGIADAARQYPERAHQADEADRIWRGLSI
jgi:hypothetical protein